MDNSNVRTNIKRNITALREINGLKMRDVANALNMKENSYRVWEDETNNSVPKAESLVRLAKIYNVSVDFILRNEDENKQELIRKVNSRSGAEGIYGDKYLNELSATEKLMVMHVRQMSSDDRNKVINLIQEIIEDKNGQI